MNRYYQGFEVELVLKGICPFICRKINAGLIYILLLVSGPWAVLIFKTMSGFRSVLIFFFTRRVMIGVEIPPNAADICRLTQVHFKVWWLLKPCKGTLLPIVGSRQVGGIQVYLESMFNG